MATIQDIFDWLNQGAQGDIPGTGGEQPNPPATSQAGGGEAGAVTPGVFWNGAQPSPGEYTGDIHPSLLPQYQHLVQSGVPPDVAHHMLTQPSMGEGEMANWGYPRGAWPYNYAGSGQEGNVQRQQPPSYQQLWQQMQNKMLYDRLNLPTWEGNTPGDDDNLGFRRLPSGQYVPWNTPNPDAQSDESARTEEAFGAGKKKGGLQAQPGYQAGMQGGTGILDMLFGSQPSQTIGDWLSGDQ